MKARILNLTSFSARKGGDKFLISYFIVLMANEIRVLRLIEDGTERRRLISGI